MADELIVDTVNKTIAADIAKRTMQHQASVARLRLAHGHAENFAAAAAIKQPLVLLAAGDSWFDYPLVDNGPLLGQTDIIAQLQQMGATPPKILSVAHFGDATTDTMSFPKQERMIQALADPSNWVSGKPDAILFSGGGNDIVGEKFCIYLNDKSSGAPGFNQQRFDLAMDRCEPPILISSPSVIVTPKARPYSATLMTLRFRMACIRFVWAKLGCCRR